ncbi:MAG: transketolase family protein, partial [Firmicutes bacterium]|nr:transketolase family protein [Bacillota bacterium]
MNRPYASTRDAFVKAMIALSERDDKYVLVLADTLLAGRAAKYQEAFPEKVFDVGIAEQNALGVSAGLASHSLVPYTLTYAGFLTMRACEQVRTFIAYPGLSVKLVGLNGGMFGGNREGVTHQFIEDIGILRSIPGITITTPADANQAYEAALAIAKQDGPCYLRLGSGKEYQIYGENEPFELGEIRIAEKFGTDVALFSSGFVLNRVLEAAKILSKQGINATVVDVHTLKPLDVDGITEVLALTRCAVTVEDHNIIGGLGYYVGKVIAEAGISTKFKVLGAPDHFVPIATAPYLFHKNE